MIDSRVDIAVGSAGEQAGKNIEENAEFKEVFNWWYFFGIVGTLVAFPLLHILAWVGRVLFM